MSAPRPRLVVGISGSSAPQLGYALLRVLQRLGTIETHLVISSGARRTIELELDVDQAARASMIEGLARGRSRAHIL